MDLVNVLQILNDKLSASLKLLRTNGSKLAETERDYKIAINKKALELKDNGMPVTLINQVIYGYQEIAKLRFDRDVAQVIYNANLESINCTKLQLRIVQEQINKEWSNEK